MTDDTFADLDRILDAHTTRARAELAASLEPQLYTLRAALGTIDAALAQIRDPNADAGSHAYWLNVLDGFATIRDTADPTTQGLAVFVATTLGIRHADVADAAHVTRSVIPKWVAKAEAAENGD